MFETLGFSSLLFVSFIWVIMYFIYSFVICPLIPIICYKGQGGKVLFHKEMVSLPSGLWNAKEKGDYFFNYNQILRKDPKTKFIVENFGSQAHIILTDTELIKEYLKKYDLYHKDLQFYSLGKTLGQGSLTFEEGASWKQRRKTISTAFNFEFLKDMIPMIVESAQEKYAEWIKAGELTVNLIDKFGTVTGEVAGRFFFGRKFSEKRLKGLPLTVGMQKLLNSVILESFTLPVILFGSNIVKTNIFPRHRELNKTIEEMRLRCQELIQETENSGVKEHTVLKFLLDMRLNSESENKLTDDDIIGEFIGVFGAGTDSSAHLASAVIYFLWKHPHVFKKVKEEAEREFTDISKITIENVNHMEYTTAVLKETLRLAGATGMLLARVATEDDNLGGVKITKGTKINVFPPLLHCSDKYYSNPMEFIPDRWLPNNCYSNDPFRTDAYAFIPFGGGPRNCIGQHLAMIESRILVALFVKTFDFTFPQDYNLVLVQRFTYQPLDPLIVTLRSKVN